MLSVINGNGRSVPDPLHFSHLIEDACDIEAHLAEPEHVEHLVAELSPIERGVIATRLLRDGIDEDTVISLMSAVKEDA